MSGVLQAFHFFSGRSGSAVRGAVRKAFLLGNAEYRYLNPLKNPHADIAGIQAKLESIGFDVQAILDRDRKNTLREFDAFIDGAQGSDVMLVYYCGHGVQLDGRNYIVPVDFDPAGFTSSDPELSLVPIDDLLTRMHAPKRIVFLDACRDDGGLSSKRFVAPITHDTQSAGGAGTRSLVAPRRTGLGHMKIDRTDTSRQTLICFSAEPGSYAEDGPEGQMSPFSKAVADQIDIRGLDVFLLAQRVAQGVREVTAGRQSPWTNAHLTEKFSFNPATRWPITVLLMLSAVTGLLGALFSFHFLDGNGALQTPTMIDATKNYAVLFVPILFGSALAAAAYIWGRRAWYVPLVVLSIYWPIAAFCRWWMCFYASNPDTLAAVRTFKVVSTDWPPEVLELVLTAILTTALTGAATVASGSLFYRELAKLQRIMFGAAIGAMGAVVFLLAFIAGRDLVNGMLHAVAKEATVAGSFVWLESFFVIALVVIWEMILARNVASAYAYPQHES